MSEMTFVKTGLFGPRLSIDDGQIHVYANGKMWIGPGRILYGPLDDNPATAGKWGETVCRLNGKNFFAMTDKFVDVSLSSDELRCKRFHNETFGLEDQRGLRFICQTKLHHIGLPLSLIDGMREGDVREIRLPMTVSLITANPIAKDIPGILHLAVKAQNIGSVFETFGKFEEVLKDNLLAGPAIGVIE